jgi:hypothetical protein
MYIMCGLLFIGFLCNFAMRAVNERYYYKAPLGASPNGSTH